MQLSSLLNPRSIAIVGASEREDAAGSRVYRNLRKMGYGGAIYLVNPRYKVIQGVTCFETISSIPEPVELIFVGLPASQGPQIIEEGARVGVRAAVIIASGYADGDENGKALQAEVRKICLDHDIALCGPNNIGFINVLDRVGLSTMPLLPECEPGPVALITQSGSVALTLSQDDRKLGLAYVITAGNEAVCTVSEYLDYVLSDDRVEIVLLFLEAIRNPKAFASACEKARTKGKHMVAVKVGRSEKGAKAAAAHTNAIAGDDSLLDAYLRRLGIIKAGDLDQLIEIGALIKQHGSPPAKSSVVALTLSGGEAALIADLSNDIGLELDTLSCGTVKELRSLYPPLATIGNPLDVWGLGWSAERFEEIVKILACDSSIGLIVLLVDAPASGMVDAYIAKEMMKVCGRYTQASGGKFIFINNLAAGGQNEEVRRCADGAGVACVNGLSTGLSAIAKWVNQGQANDIKAPERLPGKWLGRLKEIKKLKESERFDLLTEIGVPMVQCRSVFSASEAVQAADDLGYPVALKASADEFPHKTEHGLIYLNLESAEDVAESFCDLTHRINNLGCKSRSREVLVQKMAQDGIGLIVGMRAMSGFGAYVIVGIGGVLVEVFPQSAVRMCPVGVLEAKEMLAETAAMRLLNGVRGAASWDVEAAASAISTFSRLAVSMEGIVDCIEINPLIVTKSGAVGVDLLVQSDYSAL